MLEDIFYRLPRTVTRCFSGYNLLWHLTAILLTYLLVQSGFDWFYFELTRNITLFYSSLPATIIGFLVPVILPVTLFFVGKLRKNKNILNTAYAVAQADGIAWCISALYKAITGRVHPQLSATGSFTDISREFHFGFLQGGVFWGWPSSHTIVAFAVATTLIILYPKNRVVKCLSLVYALYVGLGISVSIHWFSDFAAGTILGVMVGLIVGKTFQNRLVFLSN